MGCLCGCRADNQHCSLSNRPPSPNTIFENIYAPTFAESLETSLRRVITKSEPSKRVWWRKTYGGDAQDASSPQFERLYPLQGGRSHSPALSSDSERLQNFNEKDYESSILTKEPSGSSQQFCSGRYSPPLDSCPKERPREDPSQVSIRKARASRFQALRDTFRVRAGFDVLKPPNVQTTSLESQIKRPYLEFPPKMFDYPPPSMQLGPVPESAKEYEQPPNNQAYDHPKLQNQHHYDLPVQPVHLLAFQTSPPEHQQKYSTERYRTEFSKPPSPTKQASISQEPWREKMQGSETRKIDDEHCQPKSDHMACVCGDETHDQLHNLTNRPPSPNTLLKGSWTPDSVDMSVARSEAVPSRYEPSRGVLWRHTYCGEAQDTITQQYKWGERTKSSDENRERSMLISGLPTSNLNEIEAEVKQSSLCDSKDSTSLRFGGNVVRSLSKPPRGEASGCRGNQKEPSPKIEEDPRNTLPPAEGVTHTSPSGSQVNSTNTALPNVFDLDRSNSDISVERTHSKPLQPDQGDLGCRSAPICGQREQTRAPSPVKHSQIHRLDSEAFQKPKWTSDDISRSVRHKARESDPTDRLEEQAAVPPSPLPNSCLCGCGGDAMHCLLPNRPPSPNTFYENFWAPKFSYMLSARLESVRHKIEPSKRIWWREEFGGCAPDREPTDLEIRVGTYDDLENVLRTSPPAFSDENFVFESMKDDRDQSPRRCQYSTSPPKTPIRSVDETNITLPQEVTSGLDRVANDVALYASGGKSTRELANRGPKPTLAHQSFACLSNPFGTNVFTREVGETPAKHFANDWSKSSFRASVRPHFKSPKSPTHYVPDRLPPLKIPDFSKRPPIRHKRKEYTAEEDEQLLQSTLRLLEASRLERLGLHGIPIERGILAGERPQSSLSGGHVVEVPSDTQTEKVTNAAEDIIQMNRSLYGRIEAMKLRRSLRHGTAMYQPEDSAAKGSFPISQGDNVEDMVSDTQSTIHHIEDMLSNTLVTVNDPSAEKRQRLRQSLYQKIEAMKLRRNCRQGTAIYRDNNAAVENSPLTSHGNHNEGPSGIEVKGSEATAEEHSDDDEMPSDTQVNGSEITAEEHQRRTQSLHQKIEAMKLKRDCRQGIAIYQDDDAVAESSPSTSHDSQVDLANEASAEEHQRWRQSLYQKIEVMKLRRNGRQGICIYRHGDTSADCSTTSSQDKYVDLENETLIEEHQLWRQSLNRSIEAMKLRRNGRCGTSIYRREDTAVEGSTPISGVDYFAGM